MTHLELSERVALRRVVCMYETGNRPPLSTAGDRLRGDHIEMEACSPASP
jgi:hypothetical protein